MGRNLYKKLGIEWEGPGNALGKNWERTKSLTYGELTPFRDQETLKQLQTFLGSKKIHCPMSIAVL